jgi:hypothetical protein
MFPNQEQRKVMANKKRRGSNPAVLSHNSSELHPDIEHIREVCQG